MSMVVLQTLNQRPGNQQRMQSPVQGNVIGQMSNQMGGQMGTMGGPMGGQMNSTMGGPMQPQMGMGGPMGGPMGPMGGQMGPMGPMPGQMGSPISGQMGHMPQRKWWYINVVSDETPQVKVTECQIQLLDEQSNGSIESDDYLIEYLIESFRYSCTW
ncbi:hypothetical protein J6590_098577 [Homalodisca vitripennis]|nr:hypothetical protein J6590_098577 [Homalodisca vitripennis]